MRTIKKILFAAALPLAVICATPTHADDKEVTTRTTGNSLVCKQLVSWQSIDDAINKHDGDRAQYLVSLYLSTHDCQVMPKGVKLTFADSYKDVACFRWAGSGKGCWWMKVGEEK